MFYELVDQLITEFMPSRDFESFRIRTLAELGMDPPFDEENSAQEPPRPSPTLHSAAEQHYRSQGVVAERAHPVIQRVYDDEKNQFVNIAVPSPTAAATCKSGADIRMRWTARAKALVDELEKAVVLAIIDQLWKEHLRDMDDLRSNVQHARFEQKDPLLIYKFESYELFKHMVQKMNQDVASFLLKCQLPSQPDQVKRAPGARPRAACPCADEQAGRAKPQRAAHGGGPRPSGAGWPGPPRWRSRRAWHAASAAQGGARPRVEKKTLPNEPCPCGSEKYKKCHGL